jgi:thioredoxin 1
MPMAGDNLRTLTDENFDAEITSAKGVAMVDFWAPWCGPCRRIAPVIEEVAAEYSGKAKIGKLDTDSNPRIATKFSIMSIPSLLLFKDGKVREKIMGAVAKSQITKMLDKVIAS